MLVSWQTFIYATYTNTEGRDRNSETQSAGSPYVIYAVDTVLQRVLKVFIFEVLFQTEEFYHVNKNHISC